MAEQIVTLSPRESKLVSFEATPHEAKTYQVSVNGLVGSFTAAPVYKVSVSVSAVAIEGELEVSVTVTNLGSAGTFTTRVEVWLDVPMYPEWVPYIDMVKTFKNSFAVNQRRTYYFGYMPGRPAVASFRVKVYDPEGRQIHYSTSRWY